MSRTGSARAPAGARLLQRMHYPGARYAAFCLLIAFAFILGGGSRADIQSLVVLRPLSILFLAYPLIMSGGQPLDIARPILCLLVALMALIGIQLIPLPPDLWRTLPGRDGIAEIGRHIGLTDLWRPLTLAPGRTLNSLFALGVPFATLLWLGLIGRVPSRMLVWPILAAGAATALVSLLQVIGPPTGPFYFYRITNNGVAVGLFANRNHNAAFLASLIPLIGYLAMYAEARRPSNRTLIMAACASSLLFLIPMVLVTGSRSGALLTVVALSATALPWWFASRSNLVARSGTWGRIAPAVPLLLFATTAALVYATWRLSRSLVFTRFSSGELAEETRLQALPYMIDMARDYFPAGAGFGVFDRAFQVIEPDGMLAPEYLNQAHNDPLQFVIEGGVAGAAILLVAIGWFLRAGWRSVGRFRQSLTDGRGGAEFGIFAWLALAILLGASIVDYPLRVPALMCVATILAVGLDRASQPR